MTQQTEKKQASHFAVRADVFSASIKTLGTLPWEQVHQIMSELMRSQPMNLDQEVGPPIEGAVPNGSPDGNPALDRK